MASLGDIFRRGQSVFLPGSSAAPGRLAAREFCSRTDRDNQAALKRRRKYSIEYNNMLYEPIAGRKTGGLN
jgi:hypothetical protein